MATKSQAINSVLYWLRRGTTTRYFIYRVGPHWMYTTMPLEFTQKVYKMPLKEYQEIIIPQTNE